MTSDKQKISLDVWQPSFPSYRYDNKPEFIRKKSIMPFSMIISASRNQGKSVMVRHLYEKCWESRFDLVVVFSKTLGNGFYRQFIKSKTMFDKFDNSILERLNEIQEEQRKTTGYMLNILIIFDDTIGNSTLYNEQIADLFTLGRHKAISVVYATQSPTSVSTLWRQNVTHFICLKTKGKGVQHIIDNFLLDLIDEDDCPEKERVDKFLRRLMKNVFKTDYQALVIEYEISGKCGIKDCIHTYIASDRFRRRIKNT